MESNEENNDDQLFDDNPSLTAYGKTWTGLD